MMIVEIIECLIEVKLLFLIGKWSDMIDEKIGLWILEIIVLIDRLVIGEIGIILVEIVD